MKALHLTLILSALACPACTLLQDLAAPAPATAPAAPPPAPVAHASPAPAIAVSPLQYAQNWSQRNASDQTAELERLQRNFQQQKSEDNRLRLALFHALLPQGDRSRAIALLDVAPGGENGSGRNHPLATLLLPLLQERARLEDANSASQQKLRDEQKKSDALQQKLDAIREIEKKLLERPVR